MKNVGIGFAVHGVEVICAPVRLVPRDLDDFLTCTKGQ